MTHLATESIQPGMDGLGGRRQGAGNRRARRLRRHPRQTGGLLSKELVVPRSVVDGVESGRVELSITEAEVKATQS
ncbi:MAG TPA: hypothetical protein VIV06_08075 [Candidatus Limnocylindrales bacterium]